MEWGEGKMHFWVLWEVCLKFDLEFNESEGVERDGMGMEMHVFGTGVVGKA